MCMYTCRFDVGWLKNKRYRKVHYIEQDPHLSNKEKAVLKGIHERHNNFAKGPSKMDFKYLGQAYGTLILTPFSNAIPFKQTLWCD